MKKTLHVLLIITCLIVIFMPVIVYASEQYLFELKWPKNQWYFSYPYSVTVDASGNVYVADTGNARIQKFSSDGSFLTKWGNEGTEDGQFNLPRGVAVDSSGDVYVADTYNHRIQKFRLAQQATAVPTMNEWGMIIFIVLAGIGSIYHQKRNRTKTV